MHVSPVTGHMGEYRTLYRICPRFFWPQRRAGIKEWIQQCPKCIVTCRWRRRGQELMFSWSISSPFAILYVDLWSPGNMTDLNSYIASMNIMCDMTRFVVVVPVPDETSATSATLASYFMQHVLMKFGMCHLVVIDDGIPFKGVFVAMFQAINLNYDVLAKRNHKGLSVEHFHRFLNNSVTIATEEHGTNDIFVPASIAAA